VIINLDSAWSDLVQALKGDVICIKTFYSVDRSAKPYLTYDP